MFLTAVILKLFLFGTVFLAENYYTPATSDNFEEQSCSQKSQVCFLNNQSESSSKTSSQDFVKMLKTPLVVLHNLTGDPKLAKQSQPADVLKDGKPNGETRNDSDQKTLFNSIFVIPERVKSWFELTRGQQAMLLVVYICVSIYKHRRSTLSKIKSIIKRLYKYFPRFKPYGKALLKYFKKSSHSLTSPPASLNSNTRLDNQHAPASSTMTGTAMNKNRDLKSDRRPEHGPTKNGSKRNKVTCAPKKRQRNFFEMVFEIARAQDSNYITLDGFDRKQMVAKEYEEHYGHQNGARHERSVASGNLNHQTDMTSEILKRTSNIELSTPNQTKPQKRADQIFSYGEGSLVDLLVEQCGQIVENYSNQQNDQQINRLENKNSQAPSREENGHVFNECDSVPLSGEGRERMLTAELEHETVELTMDKRENGTTNHDGQDDNLNCPSREQTYLIRDKGAHELNHVPRDWCNLLHVQDVTPRKQDGQARDPFDIFEDDDDFPDEFIVYVDPDSGQKVVISADDFVSYNSQDECSFEYNEIVPEPILGYDGPSLDRNEGDGLENHRAPSPTEEDIAEIEREQELMEQAIRWENIVDSIQNHAMATIFLCGAFIVPCLIINKVLK